MEQMGKVWLGMKVEWLNNVKAVSILLIMLASSNLSAQTDMVIKSVKGNIQGTSTLHDWESQITKVTYKGAAKTKGITIQSIKDVEVKVLVEGIKSKEGKVMDKKTYEAFKSDKNPYITFSMKTAQVKTGEDKNVTIEVTGNLTMAGTTKLVPLTAKGKVLPNNDIQITVSKKLKMTEFNMKPPKAVLGTIHVGDEVTVNFEILLSRHK